MDATFITIHDLTAESRILYASNSVIDILGYQPEEIVNHSSWDFFHPEEIPFAQAVYGRGIKLDKAAVLNYARLKHRSGVWIGCECVFSIVNDVLVGCVSQYRDGLKAQKRAQDAPIIRQLFSSSPKDPRYHMLSYISNKFTQPSDIHAREPRAALFLNRFTRTLPIMFASNGLQNVLGISSDQLHNKSFYYCIQENCLPEAIRCLESAKANDSIAYLRFWFRDPREEDPPARRPNREMSITSDEEDEDGGVPIQDQFDTDSSDYAARGSSGYSSSNNNLRSHSGHMRSNETTSTMSSRPSEVFDSSGVRQSSSVSTTPFMEDPNNGTSGRAIELEAVVSCTSDGLVVILRQARPFALDTIRQRPVHYRNGVYASPWASEPILPIPAQPAAPSLAQYQPSGVPMALGGPAQAQPILFTGPGPDDFMNTIRDVAVFAWALTGINGCLEQYSRGDAMLGAQPTHMPIWQEHAAGLTHHDSIMG